MGFWASVKAWLDAPFASPVSATDLFLVTGFVFVSFLIWTRIVQFIEAE